MLLWANLAILRDTGKIVKFNLIVNIDVLVLRDLVMAIGSLGVRLDLWVL